MSLAMICVVTDAVKTDANLVFAARGKGPDTFSVPLAPSPTTSSSAPTHWLMSDALVTQEERDICDAMTGGDLPPIDGVWGQDGVIEAATAQAAMDGANFQVFSCAGEVDPVAHKNGILSGSFDPPLSVVPGDV